jgi:hypothetical protein
VTQTAVWVIGDARILRMTVPGVFEAVGTGDTFLTAKWNTFETIKRPVSVFPGTPPMATGEIFGGVYRVGQRTFSGALDGALVVVLTSPVAGKSATSGTQPAPVPGFIVGLMMSPGQFRILGVPAGTYRVRASKEGYVTQEREVTVHEGLSTLLDFELTPEQ